MRSISKAFRIIFVSVFVLKTATITLLAAPPGAPSEFKINNTYKPLGIDTSNPRFSWVVQDTDRGESQTAYHIIVASSLANSSKDIGDKWDSGKVMSAQQSDVNYNGSALASRSIYWVKVRTWDKDGNVSAWSEAATFETAFLDSASEWTAKMLGGDYWRYRKQFSLPNKVIARARAYVSAKDAYELRINGARIGNSVVNSDAAYFAVRKWYATYDVTANLSGGAANSIGVFVGSMRVGFTGWGTYASRGFTLQLEVTYTDGTGETICSDSTWKCTKTGPFINAERNNMYDGEKYDARSNDAWDRNGYDDSTWSAATVVANTAKMTARYMEPMQITETMIPRSVSTPVAGTYVFDMGQNMSGWAQLTVAGTAGTMVTMKFGEKVTADGHVDQSNLKVFKVGAEQTDKYVLAGNGKEVWEPMFALHGFRYVEVTGFPGIPTVNSVKGRVVHQAVDVNAATKGGFSCSDPLLNKIHNAFLWGMKNNMSCGMPTDCCQRDERYGWMGDALLEVEGISYNYQVENFFSQWMNSVFDCQSDAGYVDSAGPTQSKWRDSLTSGGDVPWTSACVIIPFKWYMAYGNKSSLQQIYNKMKGYFNWLMYTQNADYTHSRNQWKDHGDWKTDPGLLSTAFYFQVADTLSKIATELGYTADASEFATRANIVKKAFNEKYLINNSYYKDNTQTANAIPLAFNMVPDNAKANVLSSLVARIQADKFTMHAGILGTYCLFDALCENGRNDIAFLLATQTTGQSWGNWIKNMNATTMFEFWDGRKSQNHAYFGGPIDSYFYKYLAGISPANPGYELIKIKPYLPDTLTRVSAAVETYKGRVASSWSASETSVTMNVIIPVNSRAEVYVPSRGHGTSGIVITEGGTNIWSRGIYAGGVADIKFIRADGDYVVFKVGSGSYSFVIRDDGPARPKMTSSLDAKDMFNSGAEGDTTRQMNLMWATFGRGEDVRLTPFGNEPGWYEWMARKHCWSDTPQYRETLHRFLVNWPQSKDGYIWSWGNEEGWPTHHVRHNENNAKYILAGCKYSCWQGGKGFLEEVDATTIASVRPDQPDVSNGRTVLEKLRAAMAYQLTTLKGQEGLAIVSDPQCDGTVDGMPSDYWDNFRFGYKSAYLNIYFYASLLAMSELERSVGHHARATELAALAARVKVSYQKTFWDSDKGRFIGCIDKTERKWDFGFTYLNLEAVTYGLTTPAQAVAIFEWLDGKRIIASDKQQVGDRMTGATGAEIYALGWAPLSTTRAVESITVDGKHWWWHLGNKITVSGARANASYGEHLENGGAIFYVSHYDMMARLRTLGPDNAWKRFEGILTEFRKDQLKRDPKNNRGAAWKWGIIGVFPESGLVPATIALGFLGLDATPEALTVNPRLPTDLPWLEARHIHYRGGIYSIRADRASIRIKAVEGATTPCKVTCDGQDPVVLPEQGQEISILRRKDSL